MAGKDKPDRPNKGRSDEARDPNRPIDPETGEKEGLGPRDDSNEADVDVNVTPPAVEDAEASQPAEQPAADAGEGGESL